MSDSLHISRWISFAQRDYDTAEKMSILHRPVPLEIVCFLCQQSAEKILKAYTIAQNGPLLKTHDLESVLKICMKYDDRFSRFEDICPVLTEYATATRYPADEDFITEQDMKIALENAREILNFTKARVLEITEKDQ
ncbi:MAG: HEPN domain-containing protein [Oscillospiraceae bacterium]|jgi:HEPN domain-containing protein|nr:HEPN domain-containing protein [Oscillospiraceae bacterium]